MEYASGVITETSNDFCVVAFPIDDTQRSFSFNKAIFYMFGMKCDGSMTNILEEGMNVDLCYKISHTDRRPVILAVWYGENPGIVHESTTVGLYDQVGRVSYCLDDESVLVLDNTGNYSVIISMEAVYRNGLGMREIGAKFKVDEDINYDAIPLDYEHPFGASFRATCAWFGAKPGLVNRFDLGGAKKSGSRNSNCKDTLNDVNGIVVTIPNDVVAIVEVSLKSSVEKVFLFRSSFEEACNSIGDIVKIGDVLSMRIENNCIFPDRKQWYAVRALKLSEEVGPGKLIVSVPSVETLNDVQVPISETSNVSALKTSRNAKVPDAESSNHVNKVDYVADSQKNHVTDCMNDTGFVNLDKRFRYERKEVKSGLRDASEIANKVMEKTVRNYVGLGVKSMTSSEGVKEVLVVNDVISTYSTVVKEGINSSRESASVGKADIVGRNLQQSSLDKSNANPRVDTMSSSLCQSAAVEMSPKSVSTLGRSECVTEKVSKNRAAGTKQPKKVFDNVTNTDSVGEAQASKSRETDTNVRGLFKSNTLLDFLNNNDGAACDSLNQTGVDCDSTSTPMLLYSEPPLSGVISRYAFDCGCINYKNFKIFVNPDSFFIDGVQCPVKHFIKYARAGNSCVNFEAVLKSDREERNVQFTHDATCAWVGQKPSLVAFAECLPPPNPSLLELGSQNFSGTVAKLYLPDSALVVIHGDATTVVVRTDSFVSKPRHSEGKFITDFVTLNDSLVFKVREIESQPKLLVAWDARISLPQEVTDGHASSVDTFVSSG